MKKFYIQTLGCDKNTVDSQGIEGILLNAGYKKTEDPVKADILLVNSCGFILDAKVQSINTTLELGANKREGQLLILCGCLAQRYENDLEKSIPEVDAFVGVDDYYSLPGIIEVKSNKNNKNNKNNENNKKNFVLPCSKSFIELPRNIEKGYTAFLKIAEGCKNVCSYCSIPLMKGKYRSRDEKAILDEAEMLASFGVKELNIIAQDVTNYGLDRKDGSNLPKLLHKLCKIDGIEWIRLLYCYEDEITDELIDCMKKEKKICHYIDIPIQHCSTILLKSMNRRSTHDGIKKTVAKLRKEIPDICIRTTYIVGLPGETKEDFKELYDFTEEMKFERLGVFSYSKEEGTKAYKMPHQVRSDVKERRKDKIMELQRTISLAHNEELIGKTIKVLVEGKEEDGIYLGRSYMDAPDIDNGVMFKAGKKVKIGSFVNVLINDAFDYDIVGEMVK